LTGRRPEALIDGSGGSGSLGISLLGDTEESDLIPALYRYNDKNQMVEAVNGNSIVMNTFNAEGLRVSKTVEASGEEVTTWYCYEYSRVIKEQDNEGSVAYNIYGTNLISRDLDDEKVYYIYNGHGDVTGLLSSSGAVIASYYYDAFGVCTETTKTGGMVSTADTNPYRYAGYQFDSESELYNLDARFYDAKIVRFMQEDTYLGNMADPLSLNLYSYCSNNPLIYWDPTGHWEVGDEKLPPKAQAQIIKLTDDYFKAQAAGNTTAMQNAQKAAIAIRTDPNNTKSNNNITTSGQAFTNAINNSSTGYLTGSSWNSVSSGSNNTATTANKNTVSTNTVNTNTANVNLAVNQGGKVTAVALATANALNAKYSDVWGNRNMNLLLKGQGPDQRQYNDLALYHALRDLEIINGSHKLTDMVLYDNDTALRPVRDFEQEALDFWYVDTSGRTFEEKLRDKGLIQNGNLSAQNDAIQISISGDVITMDVQVLIRGTKSGPNDYYPGLSTTYSQEALNGLSNEWSTSSSPYNNTAGNGQFWIYGGWVEVKTTVHEASNTSHILGVSGVNDARKSISINIVDDAGRAHADYSGINWRTDKRGGMTLYAGNSIPANGFRKVAAHELAHNLGIGDAYQETDPKTGKTIYEGAPIEKVARFDLMRVSSGHPNATGHTSVLDILKMIEANQTNTWQYLR
jgi:RHS repeat-associated protein